MNRKIAIIADPHALLEPLQAVLEDINKRGIKEIYSLGDNIGLGPNPNEVVELLEENKAKSIAGNYEEYEILGVEPFDWYMTSDKKRSRNWTSSILKPINKQLISLYPHTIELTLGNKEIALCHFANDVRFDHYENDSWGYANATRSGRSGYKQFLYTNSEEQMDEINYRVENNGLLVPEMQGILSATIDPLFNGKTIDMYDAIFQGHVHWKITEKTPFGTIYSIRSLGMAYDNAPIDKASYVILTETDNGFTVEEVLVKYDREKMEHSINTSTSPDLDIKKYTCMR